MSIDHKIFAVMWDQRGLECVQEMPHPAMHTWAVLSNTKQPESPNLNHWALRARFNSQRHYEIWIVTTELDIDAGDLRVMFDRDPQYAADMVRERGSCFYSDRVNQNDVIIT